MNKDTSGVGAMNEDTSGVGAMNEDTSGVGAMNEDTSGVGAMNKDTSGVDPAQNLSPGSGESELSESGSESDHSTTVVFRRSTRLAIEKPGEATEETAKRRMGSKSHAKRPMTSHSILPDVPLLQISNQQSTTTLKRMAPTGDGDVEALLSAGASFARPIDVDALDAVLERYPVKREPQVCTCRTINCNMTDEFFSSKSRTSRFLGFSRR